MSRPVAAALAAGCLFVPAAARALDNDPALRGFGTYDAQNHTVETDQAGFRRYVRELGMAMAPKLLAPAETLGLNGFAFSLGQYSATNIDESSEHWKKGTEQTLAETTAHESAPELNGEAQAPGMLHTLDFRVRKGLPYSLEIGSAITWLVNSELFAWGAELKWALNESVEAFPIDVAVQAAVNRCFGSTELDLTTVGLNFILGKGFGAGGVVHLAPYMAYNPVFVFAESNVLDTTPGTNEELDARDRGSSFVLASEDVTLHRFALGTRFAASVLSITPEVVLTKGIQSYNVQLGLEF